MTLFITTPRRQLAISDAYVMAVALIISFWVTIIIKEIIEKRRKNLSC
jgi:ABC-type sulfate transport system permease subunit